MASVKVAVRVRPFNKRELKSDSELVVEMHGNSVTLSGIGTSRAHQFTFDYAHSSHDIESSNYVDQETVYRDLGIDVVNNAFKGYNVCVFAYGQTGSGKTYTMMGTDEDRGLIPRICQKMFERMTETSSTTYRTEVSYLEIYNERVKDLLSTTNPSNPSVVGIKRTHALKVRENPKSGPYVQDLSKHLVMEYDEILNLMKRGNSDRTTASTNMNDTSSRSHAIFTITFVQASVSDDGLPRETVSKIHLVDLAGSERADATGATGQRLKEGAHINKSLVTLGSVISALAEASTSSTSSTSSTTLNSKRIFVPYRDSVLTWLLKDSLGGNSQTIMIATISPAQINHGETLSTLRYANRAKNIINQPTVNEDPNVKLIRELREEIERLRRTMQADPIVATEIAEKEAKERTLTEEWNEKWREAANILREQRELALKRTGLGVVLDSEKPHLIGIDEDVLSTGIVLYHLREGDTRIGNQESNCDIRLRGPDILSQHCIIRLHHGGVATLHSEIGALCLVNAAKVHDHTPVKLSQGCVIVLGRSNMFRYNDPFEIESMRKRNNCGNNNNYNNNNNGNNNGNNNNYNNNTLNQSLLSESLSDLRHEVMKSSFSESDLKDGGTSIPFSPSLSPVKCDSTSTISSLSSQHQQQHHHHHRHHHHHQQRHPISDDLIQDTEEMTKLYERIQEQKEVIMKCLENEQVRVEMLNEEISRLQEMQIHYGKLEYSKIQSWWNRSKSRLHDDEDDDEEEDVIVDYDDEEEAEVEEGVERVQHQDVHVDDVDVDEEYNNGCCRNSAKLRYESNTKEIQALRLEKDKEINELRKRHETEIYVLKRKLYGMMSNSNPSFHNGQTCYPFILISIPKFRLITSNSNDIHVQYEVQITISSDTDTSSWAVYRRFREFRDLHVTLTSKYGNQIGNLTFPPRKLFGSCSHSVSQERQRALQTYLNKLIQTCLQIQSCPLVRIRDKVSAIVEFSPFFKKIITSAS